MNGNLKLVAKNTKSSENIKSKTNTKKIFLFTIIFFSLILVFQGCSKFQNQKSSKKNQLELSFSQKLDRVPLFYLTSLIGSGSGKTENFGEKKDLLLFFEEDDCSTCQKVKTVLEEFIRKTGTKIYSYSEDKNDSPEEKANFLKKLGSPDGQNLTAARLIAFVNGKRVASISGTYDLETSEKIESFTKFFFNLPPKIKSQELRELNGLKDLRQALNEENDFLLYLNRFSCPYCRSLEDTKKFNTITYLAQNSNAKIYSLTSENSLKELKKEVSVDGKKYKSSFEYLEKSGASQKFWNSDENEKKKTEFIEILVALELVQNNFDDDEKFLKEITKYAFSKQDKFLKDDRNVPCFILCKNSKQISAEKQKQIKRLLDEIYTLSFFDENVGGVLPENANLNIKSGGKAEDVNLTRKSTGEVEDPNLTRKSTGEKNFHRKNFTNYFAPNCSKLDAETYNSYLLKWISLSLF